MNEDLKSYFFDIGSYNYKIQRLELLSNNNNLNLGTYRYKISYISKESGKLLRDVFMVGKFIKLKRNPYKIDDSMMRVSNYYHRMKALRKIKKINYSFRMFENNLEFVECVNFNKEDLFRTIFLKDLNLNSDEVIPINHKNLFNKEILRKKGGRVWLYIFEKVMEDVVILFENNFFIDYLDLWMVIFKESEVDLEIVDLDCLTKRKEIHFENYFVFCQVLANALKKFINRRNVKEYERIIQKTLGKYFSERQIRIYFEKKLFSSYKIKLDFSEVINGWTN